MGIDGYERQIGAWTRQRKNYKEGNFDKINQKIDETSSNVLVGMLGEECALEYFKNVLLLHHHQIYDGADPVYGNLLVSVLEMTVNILYF